MKAPFMPDRKLIRREHVDSTALRSVGYDSQRAVLQVELLEGAIYDYLGVPAEEYAAFMKAGSKGRYYSRVFKPKGYQPYLVRERATA
jgi:hypothetical protein